MISLRLCSKVCVVRRYSTCAGNIYKTKLGQVFDNLKPGKLNVTYSTKQNVTRGRILDKGTGDRFSNKPRYHS
jgi:hypothetical protein